MRIRGSFWILCIAGAMVGASACGGNEDGKAISIPSGLQLIDSLPYALPTPQEYSELLDAWGNPPVIENTGRNRSNADMAPEPPTELLWFPKYIETTVATGRKTGYLAGYTAGTQGLACCNARMAIDLYESEADAQRRLEDAPTYATSGLHPGDIGDSAVAWLGPGFGDAPAACPCELWFRVGPLVAAILTTYAGPIPGPGLDPVQKELALLIVQRMRAVLESTSPE